MVISDLIRLRRFSIFVWTILLCTLVFINVRSSSLKFSAEIELLVDSAQGESLNLFQGVDLNNPLGMDEKDRFILSQESILFSDTLFKMVKSEFKDEEPKQRPTHKTFLKTAWNKVIKALFGHSYLKIKRKYSHAELNRFRDELKFVPKSQTGSFLIRYSSDNPKQALQYSDLVAKKLIEIDINRSKGKFEKSLEFLENQLKSYRAKAQASSQKIVRFVSRNNFFSGDEIFVSRVKKLLEIESDAKQASIESMVQSSVLSLANEEYEKLTDELKTRMFNNNFQNLIEAKEKLSALKNIEKETNIGRKKRNSEKKELTNAIKNETVRPNSLISDEELQVLLSDAKKDLTTRKILAKEARNRSSQLKDVARKYLKDLKRYPQLEAQLNELMLGHTQLKKLEAMLSQNYLATLINRDKVSSRMTILGSPEISITGFTSSKIRSLLGGWAFSFILVLITTIVYDLIRGTIVSSKQIDEIEGITHIGNFPYIPNISHQDLIAYSHRSDQIKRLAFAVRRQIPKKPGKGIVVLVTSHDSGAGKSTLSLLLSSALSKKSDRVMAIDCDPFAERRNLEEFYSSSNHASTIMRLDDIINATQPSTNRSLLVANLTNKANPEMLHQYQQEFDGAKVSKAISSLRNKFDYIIIDSPPLSVAESFSLCEDVDAIVLCVNHGKETEVSVRESILAIERNFALDSKILTVLTKSSEINGDLDVYRNYTYRRKAS